MRDYRDASESATKKDQLNVRRQNGKIWSPIRNIWKIETPEERVRQEYLCVLVNEYGYKLDQIAEEYEVTGHRGSGKARADFVIWRSLQDKIDGKSALIVIECKSDNVTIEAKDYWQGDSYARYSGARFFVTHNNRETKYWKVILEDAPKTFLEIDNIPHANASDKEIEEVISKLKLFKEDEFANLLHQCHNIIRNREKKDPAASFDEIAKVLFIKVWVEREMRRKKQRKNVFTADWLDTQLGENPLDVLFQQTKEFYLMDKIFEPDEHINLKPSTGREIVRKLEIYNLSDTSEDIKGIAFERFLGKTFRGEIGQFFTPRTIVEFMVRMIEPREGDIICDPACGSGGFLIRFFEIVRQKILADADQQYREFRLKTDKDASLSDEEKAEALRSKFAEIQETIDQSKTGSRLWTLANRCIFGADANDRMARTSKMNMIMHGDGHGGVHHHDGFLNINGIFEGRFDIILTNPPFGANVESSDVVQETDIATTNEMYRRYLTEYGDLYREAQDRMRAAIKKPIISLFKLPKNQNNVKTEILFIERCLDLLKPGGRLGIVLPEGIFNNPSRAYVREFCEDHAFIRAIVSLPQDTFISSGASVKASLLFMQKFTEEERNDFEAKRKASMEEITINRPVKSDTKSNYNKMNIKMARRLLKERFSYLIFLYDAERVGLTATGEPDQNELYPNPNQPEYIKETCLELYTEFLSNPEAFLINNGADNDKQEIY